MVVSAPPDLAAQVAALSITVDAILAPGAASHDAAIGVLAGTMAQFAALLGTALARVTELEAEQARLVAALFAAGLHVHPPS